MSSRMGDHNSYHRKLSSVAQLSTVSQELINLAGEAFYVVNPTKTMVETVLKTWEERPSWSENPPCLSQALKHLDYFYRDTFKELIATDEMVFEWMDMDKSSGYLGVLFDLKSKKAQLGDRGFQAYLQKFRKERNRRAFHKITPKIEVLPLENILMNKCRFFVIPELLLVMSQLKFGKLVSLRLKNYRWSAYGFNPYAGGVNRLARRLLSKRIRFYYDVSGWDKFLNLLRKLYETIKIHSGYAHWTTEEQAEFDWMVENTCEMDCVFYDGSVYRKSYGNGSGSGTTTRDNILAHIIIIAAILYAAYHDKFGKYPDPFLVEEQIINLFGDDSICSVDEEFDSVLKPDFVANMFKAFGMKLKFFYGGLDYRLEDMEFLGFRFYETETGWIPLYNEVRLATGMIYNGVNSNTREAILSKITVLSFMALPCPHYYLFKQYAQDVAKHFLPFELTPSEKAMVEMILHTEESELLSIFLGEESSNAEVFKFFSSALEEDGIKDLLPSCQTVI